MLIEPAIIAMNGPHSLVRFDYFTTQMMTNVEQRKTELTNY